MQPEQHRHRIRGIAIVVRDENAPRAGRGRHPARERAAAGAAVCTTGSRTTKRLPRSGPSLVALTEPPCCSTRRFTRVRPSPSPSCARARGLSPGRTARRSARDRSGAMRALVRDGDRDLVSLSPRLDLDARTPGAVLAGVVEEVHEHLGETQRVRMLSFVTPDRRRGPPGSGRPSPPRDGSPPPPRSRPRPARRCASVQLELVLGDAAHLEQVVDQSGEVRHLTLITPQGRAAIGVGQLAAAQHLDRAADGIERIAESRGPAWRGTRPCDDRPGATPPPSHGSSRSARRRSSSSSWTRRNSRAFSSATASSSEMPSSSSRSA